MQQERRQQRDQQALPTIQQENAQAIAYDLGIIETRNLEADADAVIETVGKTGNPRADLVGKLEKSLG